MADQTFGPCRSRATTKPRQSRPDPVFYLCKSCGRILYSMGDSDSCGEARIQCCGRPMEQLRQQDKRVLPPECGLDYKIVGGFNNNAIKVSWSPADPAFQPKWIFLKNYTGGQLKFIPKEKRSPAVFPLADEDAYAYCDEDPCLECVFCCKFGFSFFVYFEQFGLIALPVDRKRANWQSAP